ncbi:unnamed protein product [Brassica oleracea var. botrytis]|uniref:Uncharacterized protein n=2 Tax=Brassica TaxID=3705 RepID=A0A0D3A6H2_BRAOL|nr:unnamed protein product [Brassica napus]CDY68143.1 BnaC01g41660D [Brassica napus]
MADKSPNLTFTEFYWENVQVSPLKSSNLRRNGVIFPLSIASSSSGKRALRCTWSNYSSSLRRDLTEEKDEKIVPNQCIWTLVEENEWPNELKDISTILPVAARTNFEEMDLLAYSYGGCNHFEHCNSVQYLLGHFQGLGSHEPQVQKLHGACDDEYENDDDGKWRRRRRNDGNGSDSGLFGSDSDRSKV